MVNSSVCFCYVDHRTTIGETLDIHHLEVYQAAVARGFSPQLKRINCGAKAATGDTPDRDSV